MHCIGETIIINHCIVFYYVVSSVVKLKAMSFHFRSTAFIYNDYANILKHLKSVLTIYLYHFIQKIKLPWMYYIEFLLVRNRLTIYKSQAVNKNRYTLCSNGQWSIYPNEDAEQMSTISYYQSTLIFLRNICHLHWHSTEKYDNTHYPNYNYVNRAH